MKKSCFSSYFFASSLFCGVLRFLYQECVQSNIYLSWAGTEEPKYPSILEAECKTYLHSHVFLLHNSVTYKWSLLHISSFMPLHNCSLLHYKAKAQLMKSAVSPEGRPDALADSIKIYRQSWLLYTRSPF